METHVYANDREICSQAADGKATAFPDTCYSPGAPYPGVPTPYPNTAKATDLANGSKTVFIRGTPLCLRDKSYIGTSTGDDPATQGLGKGVLTGALKGKAYFTSWSMDVKAEGYNVTRHQDSITHNHASTPGNTPPTLYMDTPSAKGKCASDLKRIQKKCQPEPEEAARKKKKGLMANIRKAADGLDRIGKTAAAYKRKAGGTATSGNAWMDDHCTGLWITPDFTVNTDFKAALDNAMRTLQEDKWSLLMDAFDELGEVAVEAAGNVAKKKITGFLVKTGLKAVVGGAAAKSVIVPILMGAWTLYDLMETAEELAELAGKEGKAILDAMGDLKNIEEKAQAILDDYAKNPHKAQANAMELLAKLNACTRARKCMLVPYQNTTSALSETDEDQEIPAGEVLLKAPAQAQHGNGCCPGQTGHHVLPGAMFKDAGCSYDHSMAPTICLEGRSNAAAHGSHGKAHGALKESIAEYKAKNGDAISYNDAKKQGLDAIEKAGAGHCDRACLEAQLDAFYKDCNKGNAKNLKARSGMGGAQPATTTPGKTKSG